MGVLFFAAGTMTALKNRIGLFELLLLQETKSSSKLEQEWKDNFHGQVSFSHKKSSCGVLTAYSSIEKFTVEKQQTDKEGCILVLEVPINETEYILINLQNTNTEKERIEVLSNLFAQLTMFAYIQINTLL